MPPPLTQYATSRFVGVTCCLHYTVNLSRTVNKCRANENIIIDNNNDDGDDMIINEVSIVLVKCRTFRRLRRRHDQQLDVNR